MVAKTAPDALRLLWAEGFFVEERTWEEAGVELSKKGYNFAPDALRMAANRANFLTRRGKKWGKKFIQKYPYDPKEEESIKPEEKLRHK